VNFGTDFLTSEGSRTRDHVDVRDIAGLTLLQMNKLQFCLLR
jgi:UDP-glucose 4-epimerase